MNSFRVFTALAAVSLSFLPSVTRAEPPNIFGAKHIVGPMTLNATGFISWLKVANPGTESVGIYGNIYWTLADGTEDSVTQSQLGSVDAGGVATVSEATILSAMGNPTQLADVVVTVILDSTEVIVYAEKKASDGRLPVPVERVYLLKDPYDTDEDGMRDSFENIIIYDDANDGITSIADVLPDDDYDNDGATNLEEYNGGDYYDPTDANSKPPVQP